MLKVLEKLFFDYYANEVTELELLFILCKAS